MLNDDHLEDIEKDNIDSIKRDNNITQIYVKLMKIMPRAHNLNLMVPLNNLHPSKIPVIFTI